MPAPQAEQPVRARTTGRTRGFLGEPRVNVLELNIAPKGLMAKS
ncbi:potassium-transporting ATPase subunit C [Streptomyces flaveolus]